MDDGRKARGQQLAMDKRIKHIKDAMWMVPSQSGGSGGYLVDTAQRTCSCPDFELHLGKCKHQWAVELRRTVETAPDGSTVVIDSIKVTRKTTYTQNWPAYNAAQCDEKDVVQELLHSLCSGISEPPYKGTGRRPIPLPDIVFGMTMKVYTTMSGRRATSDIRACTNAGHMARSPHYNSLFNYMEKPELTPLLMRLVQESAAPLAGIEEDFAVDSTGFGTVVYRRWFDHKYGREMKEHRWVKAHAMVGVKTNVITAVCVTEGDDADCPELPGLVRVTRERFEINEVSADKAYLSHENLAAIEAIGATPFVPFKTNSRSDGSSAWRRMCGMFMFQHEDFLAHYHKRSNVESTFSAVKRKFGGSVRSKGFTAQVNEVLCKCLAYNLSCLVHAMRELGISPTFQPVVRFGSAA